MEQPLEYFELVPAASRVRSLAVPSSKTSSTAQPAEKPHASVKEMP